MAESSVPTIDFAPFMNGTEAEKLEVAHQVFSAFKTIGFLILKNHTVPIDLIERGFDHSKQFFDLPMEQKKESVWETPESNRGFVPPGMEKLSNLDKDGKGEDIAKLHASLPDAKESFEIGKEPDRFRNMWPKEEYVPGFKDTMLKLYDEAHNFNVLVMRCIAMALGQSEHALDGYVDKKDNNLRLLHYPGVERAKLEAGLRRAGEHSDYGSITLLFMRKGMTCSGLQVQEEDGTFLDCPFVENAVIVNAADLLQRWSNDIIHSTIHRVVQPKEHDTEDGLVPPRYTIVYFCNPNFDQEVHVLPGCSSEENPPKYPPVNSFDYLVSRLSATYFTEDAKKK